MKKNDIVALIREEFAKRLQAKTGWGRNDVMKEYDQAVSTVIMRIAAENNLI